MNCPNCNKTAHVSHIGVTVCLHCGHIGQTAGSTPKKGASKLSPRLDWVRGHTFISAMAVVIGIELIAIGGQVVQHTQSHPVTAVTSSKATKTKPVDSQSTTVSTPTSVNSTTPAVTTPPVQAQPQPKPASVPVPQPPSPIVSNSLCRVDATQAPDQLFHATEMARTCQTVYPQLVSRLSASNCQAPHVIVFDQNKYAAYAQDCVVHVSIEWLRNSPYDPGLIPHELTHTVQQYGSIAPSWITEGIATYMSYKLGYSIGIAHCNSNEDYQSGYGCSASLLNYIERVYWPSVIKDVNGSIKANTYSDGLFSTKTGGKNLKTLYDECQTAECRGGK